MVYRLLIHYLDPSFSTWAFGTSCGVTSYFRVDIIRKNHGAIHMEDILYIIIGSGDGGLNTF